VLVAGLWWWYSRDNPADHAAVNEAELDLIREGREDAESDGETDGGGSAWLRVLMNRDVLMLTLSYSSMNYVFYIVFNWFFYYLVEVREFSATDAGFVASAQWVAGAAGAALGGWLCDFMCRRFGLRWGCRWPVIIGMTASAVLLLIGAFHTSPMIAVAAMVLLFFFNQVNEGPYWATSIAVGGSQAGAAGGVMNTGANVMGIINSLLIPLIAQAFGWTFAIASGAVFALLGVVLMLLVRADRGVD
jgi:ACS family glucarate transporter-like MFS transporter